MKTIAGDETRGDAEPAQRLDHEQRIVAAGAGAGLQRVERVLRALLVALAIGEGLADAMRHAAQDVEGRRRPLGVEKFPAQADSSPWGSPYCGVTNCSRSGNSSSS